MLCAIFQKPIGQVPRESCIEQSRIFARRTRCIQINCPSPNRLCVPCVEQGAAVNGKDLEGCFSEGPDGFCPDHRRNGKDWRKEPRTLAPECSFYQFTKKLERSAKPVKYARPIGHSASAPPVMPAPPPAAPITSIEEGEKRKRRSGRKEIDPKLVAAVLAWRQNHPAGETQRDLATRLGIPLNRIIYILYIRPKHLNPSVLPDPEKTVVDADPVDQQEVQEKVCQLDNAARALSKASQSIYKLDSLEKVAG